MSLDAVAAALTDRLSGRVERDFDLAGATTYRVGGRTALFVEPASMDDLEVLGEVMAASGRSLPLLTLGRGSNVVISDRGFPGLTIKLGSKFSWIEPLEDDRPGLTAGGATPLPVLANWAARRGLAGMEFLVAIPGSVGGAVRMNAGAHGRDIGDCLVSARVLDLQTRDTGARKAEELELAYRRSNLGAEHIVIDARFGLAPEDGTAVRTRMEQYRRHRAETQPGAVQNAGSVFKNPPGDSAGRLVEAAGLKGFRVGGARVSELHANFFIASDDATAQEIYDLVTEVRERVRLAFGIELEPEIRFVGEFDDPVRVGEGRR